MRKRTLIFGAMLLCGLIAYSFQIQPRSVDAAGTNLALSGIGYRWQGLTSATSNSNRYVATGINDNNLTTDVHLTGNANTDDNVGAYEGSGVVWSSAQTLTSVNFINGSFDSNSNGVFTAAFSLQFSTDGTTWVNSGWKFSPAYAYDQKAAGGVTYIFSGIAASPVLGVRVVGQVHSTVNSSSWHASARELQAYGSTSPTKTYTPIKTNTATLTRTAVNTATKTDTPTKTNTPTLTKTALNTATSTVSIPTVTKVISSSTPTATPTFVPPTKTGTPPPLTHWVQLISGHLAYKQDAQGNRIPDYSYAGYGQNALALPVAPVKATITPVSSGDDTARIQQALDNIAKLTPDATGIRGAVLLKAGTYRLNGTLNLNASGVVLRGEGSSTVLLAQGAVHTIINMQGTGSWSQVGAAHTVTDTYVPVGAYSFHIDTTTGLHVGDHVIVQRPVTQTWIHAIGMDQIPAPANQWTPSSGLHFDRIITAIQGNQITIDAPLTNALEKQYTTATVWGYTFSGRISQVGVENLSSDGTEFEGQSGYTTGGIYIAIFLYTDAVENGWVNNVTIQHFGNGIIAESTAKWLTLSHIQALNMGSTTQISAQPFVFSINGQQILLKGCTITGNYIHAWATKSATAGPNVITQCTASGIHIDAQGHQYWGTGTLFDDLTINHPSGVTGYDLGGFGLNNRGNQGHGHGWGSANDTLYNCNADNYLVEDPPTAHNWAIGCLGTVDTSIYPRGEIEFAGQPVQPISLYDQQLADRLSSN